MGKKNNKPIIELDKPNGKLLRYWESARVAGAFYGIHPVNISYNVKNITKQAKGHYFRFATENEKKQFSKITNAIDAANSALPPPVDDKNDTYNGPATTIINAPYDVDIQPDTLSPFARLLEESKKKYKNNPE